jgi:hypothetical protein
MLLVGAKPRQQTLAWRGLGTATDCPAAVAPSLGRQLAARQTHQEAPGLQKILPKSAN